MNLPKAVSSSRLKVILPDKFAVFAEMQILPNLATKERKARSLLKLVAYQCLYQIVREHLVNFVADPLKKNFYKL